MSLISAVLAHKFLVAVALASLATTGGVITVSDQLNAVGTMTFTVNSSIDVTSLASLNFGTLNPGDTKTATSTAAVNITSSGNYTLSLVHRGLLHEVFSAFTVSVDGLGSSSITLNLTHEAQTVALNSGLYHLTITVQLTVKNEIDHTITATDVPFLGIGHFPPNHFEDNDNGDQDDE